MSTCVLLCCSAKCRVALVKADLIPQLINTLNPQSLSFAEAEDLHINLMKTIHHSLSLTTSYGLEYFESSYHDEPQAFHEMVLQEVLTHSEKCIRHLCANRFSIIDGSQSKYFLELLAHILHICPYYQPTMDFVVRIPIVLTIPSGLTFFENKSSIRTFLSKMNYTQWGWNDTIGEERQMWKTVDRMLRTEGVEDVIEEMLQNDKNEDGRWVVVYSCKWNNLLGMNLPDVW